MSDLSEEEIIKKVKDIILKIRIGVKTRVNDDISIEGLLDLYNKAKKDNLILATQLQKEKEKNLMLEGNKVGCKLTIEGLNENSISKYILESYKKELEETKKHLNSNCNIALMDFGIDLINHILKGETNDKLSLQHENEND